MPFPILFWIFYLCVIFLGFDFGLTFLVQEFDCLALYWLPDQRTTPASFLIMFADLDFLINKLALESTCSMTWHRPMSDFELSTGQLLCYDYTSVSLWSQKHWKSNIYHCTQQCIIFTTDMCVNISKHIAMWDILVSPIKNNL